MTYIILDLEDKIGDIRYASDCDVKAFDPTPKDGKLSVQDQEDLVSAISIDPFNMDESVEKIIAELNRFRVLALKNRVAFFSETTDPSSIFLDSNSVKVRFTPTELADLARTKQGARRAGELMFESMGSHVDSMKVFGNVLSQIKDNVIVARLFLWTEVARERPFDNTELSLIFDPEIWKKQEKRIDQIATFAFNSGTPRLRDVNGKNYKEFYKPGGIMDFRNRVLELILNYHDSLSVAGARDKLEGSILNLPGIYEDFVIEYDAKNGRVSNLYIELIPRQKNQTGYIRSAVSAGGSFAIDEVAEVLVPATGPEIDETTLQSNLEQAKGAAAEGKYSLVRTILQNARKNVRVSDLPFDEDKARQIEKDAARANIPIEFESAKKFAADGRYKTVEMFLYNARNSAQVSESSFDERVASQIIKDAIMIGLPIEFRRAREAATEGKYSLAKLVLDNARDFANKYDVPFDETEASRIMEMAERNRRNP